VTTRAEALTALRAQWDAEYEIWFVPLSTGGERWCARRHGAPLLDVTHADSPEHLAEYLADAEMAP
jgi:hypothetical protein